MILSPKGEKNSEKLGKALYRNELSTVSLTIDPRLVHKEKKLIHVFNLKG